MAESSVCAGVRMCWFWVAVSFLESRAMLPFLLLSRSYTLRIIFHHLGITTSADLLKFTRWKRIFKSHYYRNNPQLSFAQQWWEFGSFMFTEWPLFSTKIMQEQKGSFYGCSFPLNFDRTQPGTMVPLRCSLASVDLRLSLKIYKATVNLWNGKDLGRLSVGNSSGGNLEPDWKEGVRGKGGGGDFMVFEDWKTFEIYVRILSLLLVRRLPVFLRFVLVDGYLVLNQRQA